MSRGYAVVKRILQVHALTLPSWGSKESTYASPRIWACMPLRFLEFCDQTAPCEKYRRLGYHFWLPWCCMLGQFHVWLFQWNFHPTPPPPGRLPEHAHCTISIINPQYQRVYNTDFKLRCARSLIRIRLRGLSRPCSSNSASSLKKEGMCTTTPVPMRFIHPGFMSPDGRRWKW